MFLLSRHAASKLAATLLFLAVSVRVAASPPTVPGDGGDFADVTLADVLAGRAGSFQREISGGQVHRYCMDLAQGEYMQLVILQLGVDLVLSLADPEGRTLVESDSPPQNYGFEQVRWIADRAGSYCLEVRPLEKDAVAGCYELRLGAFRPSVPADRILVDTELAFGEGSRLDTQQDAKSLKAAVEKYVEAFTLFRRGGDLDREAAALDCLAADYAALGDYPTALEFFDEALQASRAAADEPLEGHALFMMGTIESSVGRTSQALEHFQRALSIEIRIGDLSMEAEVLANLGRLQDSLGEKSRARELFERVLSLSRTMRNHDLEARTLNRLGSLFQSGGEKARALATYLQGLSVVRTGPNRVLEALILSSLGRVLNELGDSEGALRHFGRALGIVRANEDRHSEANILFETGRTRAALGDSAKAFQDFSAALPIVRAVNDPRLEAAVLNATAGILAQSGRSEEALPLFDQGLAVARNTSDPYREADILTSRGPLLGRLGRREAGLEDLRRAALLRRRVGDIFGEAVASYQSALLERDRGNRKEARDLVEAAITTVESVRGRVVIPELRASFFGLVHKYYELEIDLLMGDDEETEPESAALAIGFSERAKARTLLDLLTEAGADLRADLRGDLLERERALRRRLRAKMERQVRVLAGTHSEEESRGLATEVDSLAGELQELEAEIRDANPRYASLVQTKALDLGGIQKDVLDDQTVLLEYFLGERRSVLWAVSRGSLKTFRLPPRAEIEGAARRLHALWARSTTSGEAGAGAREAQKLTRMLLAPAAELLGRRRLLIVADGALLLIPFGALPSPGASGKQRRTALIEEHEIVSLPSASVLAVQRRALAGRPRGVKTLAVLADPVFERGDVRLRGLKGRESAGGSGAEARRGGDFGVSAAGGLLSGEDFRLSRLPFTRREARAILQLVPAADRKEALDFDASLATVESEEIANSRYLHLATHGLINGRRPELSGVVLSFFDRDGREQDGFLSTVDVFNMKLRAELVVLSACRTALGKEIRGEGLVGLTRAFLYAGAARVVASLWKVDDAATAELMKQFYLRMLGPEHLTPAAALRAAQVAMKRQKRWEHPSYWAAFSLQGEWN